MEEKKLTDEEIIHDLEEFAKDTEYGAIYKNALNLIHRLQAENETLKSKKFGMWKVKFFKAQEEIERLTEENEYLDMCGKQFFADYQKCEVENAELQKQVDELQDICLDCPYKLKFDEIEKQAVKDTAKEILQSLIDKAYVNECIDLTVAEVKAWFREDYGVEVE